MDPKSQVAQLCIAGTQAEYRKQLAEARGYHEQAWAVATDDYEACIAAHYMARLQENAESELDWNQEALRRAEAALIVKPTYGWLKRPGCASWGPKRRPLRNLASRSRSSG